MEQKEVEVRVQQDQFKIYENQETVFKPISYNEAMARALKYNLDYRLKLMESALSQGLGEVAKYDMLPNLLVSAGYSVRNNLSASQSFRINPDGSTTELGTYTGGQEKQRQLAGAEFSWNILDFGVGYYRAKQQSNQYLIAEERRRRVVQNIIQDVRSAYWRAVGAQRLSKDAENLLERVKSALQRSREAESLGPQGPKEALNYQRMLVDAVSLLTARRQELELAKRELAALMNITPGSEFSLSDEPEAPLSAMPENIAELEETALINRPELRQEDYQARITRDEAKKQLLYLLPNLSLNIGAQYDSNKYLYNRDWVDASTRVTFNLFRALAIPATQRAQEAQVKTDDFRRMALSMAILTQVRVALGRYRMALEDLEIAKESSSIDQRLVAYAKAALSTKVESELELIRAETRALNSEFQRAAAYANAQAAFGRILNSVGMDVVPEGLEQANLEELGQAVANSMAALEKDTFVTSQEKIREVPNLRVNIRMQGNGGQGNMAGNPVRLTKDTHLNNLAKERYPDSQELRDQFRYLVVLANPNIAFPQENPGVYPLKAGTRLVMPANLPKAQVAVVSVAVPVAGPATDAAPVPANFEGDIRNAVEQALLRNRLRLAKASEPSHTLTLDLTVDPVRNGMRRANWLITLRDGEGSEIGSSRYASILTSELSRKSLLAFAEAATVSNLRNLNNWLANPVKK